MSNTEPVEEGVEALESTEDARQEEITTSEVEKMADFAVMEVSNVFVNLPETFAMVTLLEHEPPFRAFEMPVGLADGAAIAAETEERPAPRPTTQDLLATALMRTGIDVIAARITGIENGNYLAEVDLLSPNGRVVIACRPSDAINLALRHPGRAPILVDVTLCG